MANLQLTATVNKPLISPGPFFIPGPRFLGQKRTEEYVLINDALNTFYLRLYGVGHMVKDHSDSERENPLPATWATLSD